MLEFLSANIGTIFVALTLVIILSLIILKMRKDKRNGKGCGCDCAGCPSKGMCHQNKT